MLYKINPKLYKQFNYIIKNRLRHLKVCIRFQYNWKYFAAENICIKFITNQYHSKQIQVLFKILLALVVR